MAVMRREQFSAALDVALRKAIINSTKRKPMIYSNIYNVTSSTRNREYDRTFTGFNIAVEKPEGKNIIIDDMKQAYETIYTHIAYGLGARVTHEMLEDDQHRIMGQIPTNLGMSINRLIETLAASPWNNGFTTNQGDGVPVFSASHPLKKAGGVHSNLVGTVDLGYSVMQTAISMIRNQVSDCGTPLELYPKTLLIHPDNIWIANKIFGKDGEPDTANRNINLITNQGIQIVTWNYLTDADAWFLISDKSDHNFNWFWREKPSTETEYHKRKKAYSTYMYFRCSCGVSDWRGTVASPGNP